MRNFTYIVLTFLFLQGCAGIQHPEIAVYQQYNSMLDRCNVIGPASGTVYMGMNSLDNRTPDTIQARNAMRKKAKELGADSIIPGEVARSDMIGNYTFTMTALNCKQLNNNSKNMNYRESLEERLAHLKAMYTKGVITEEEYKRARQEAINQLN